MEHNLIITDGGRKTEVTCQLGWDTNHCRV